MPRPRELMDLLAGVQTYGDQQQAGIIGDWLEEYGDTVSDAPLLALMRWLQTVPADWFAVSYGKLPRRDLNWSTTAPRHLTIREPVRGSTWAVNAYRIRPVNFYLWTGAVASTTPIIYVTTPHGYYGPVVPDGRPAIRAEGLRADGIPELDRPPRTAPIPNRSRRVA